MKYLVSVYTEGNNAKAALLEKEKESVKVLRVLSLSVSAPGDAGSNNFMLDLETPAADNDLSFDELENIAEGESESGDASDISRLNSILSGIKLSQVQFMPVVGEPTANYHFSEMPADANKKKLLQAIISDIYDSKGVKVTPDMLGYTEFDEKTILSVFLEGDIPAVSLINRLANFNKRRYLKIPAIKPAELSLAYYAAKNGNFFPEDNTLIIYIGRETSKLIFLEGNKLKHIGATLDVGVSNLHTYDVYFSKILLEMENGGISKLDNIILCGEDRSENLILSFYGTFPEANVSEMKFEDIDISELSEENQRDLALYSIPISAGVEYFDELDKKHKGVNILPRYIQENQKFLQFGWHSYALMPLLFGATFFFTFEILSNMQKINELDMEIARLNQKQIQNQALIEEITPLQNRINSFDATQSILDSATVDAGIWSDNLSSISDFMERRRNFWISKFENPNPGDIIIYGFSLSRSVLTEFARNYPAAVVKSINSETIREKTAFSYIINLKLNEKQSDVQ
ncbi:MAG: hypothetical protein ACOYVE_03130 [Melioribacter sp.]|uniref:hypothetical protein n=1 Tax=Melioribacter sp. TaxID=2052167 RepID=UPI003BD3B992